MPSSTRIKGKSLTLKLGTTDYAIDATSVVLESEEADNDVTTFADAAAGAVRQWFFTITAIQSTDAASFWRYLWDNSGTTAAYVFAPHGNAVPSASQPHFTGNVTIGPKPNIGGEANSTFTFEYRLDCNEAPTLDTTP